MVGKTKASVSLSAGNTPIVASHMARLVGVLGIRGRATENQRNLFVSAYLRGEVSIGRLAKAAGVSRPTAEGWLSKLQDVETQQLSPLGASEKRQILADLARSPEAAPAVRLNSIDLDNKMAGDYAPVKTETTSVLQLTSAGGTQALRDAIGQRLVEWGIVGKGEPRKRLPSGRGGTPPPDGDDVHTHSPSPSPLTENTSCRPSTPDGALKEPLPD